MSALPPNLQPVCDALRFYSPFVVARRLGIKRSTVLEAMDEIRKHFVAAGFEGVA